MYHFQQLERLPDFAFQSRFGKLLSAPPQRNQDFINQGRSGEYAAQFRGALLRLFGEPIAPPGDAIYEYVLKVSKADPAGRSWILTAYEGPSGPAIGGPGTDPSAVVAAAYLLELIDTTVPADFEVTQYHDEYGTTTTCGCKDGTCYYFEARGRVLRATTNLHEQELQALIQHDTTGIEEWKPDQCMTCGGDGRCALCDGEGDFAQIRDYDDSGDPIYYPPPYPKCPECHGSGICKDCNGTGKQQPNPDGDDLN